jgi:hypothetical protein
MQEHPLRLPPVVYDTGLDTFITLLGLQASQANGRPLVVDMQEVAFYTPGPIAGLLVALHRWVGEGREVRLENAEFAPAFTYLQRMDFFAMCGLKLPESFRRHDGQGRFVALRRIDPKLAGDVDAVAMEIARCLFPEQADSDDPEKTGPHDLAIYAITELINNVLQHARAGGFTLAQVYPQLGLMRLAIADFGIGIRGSLAETWPDLENPAASDLDAIRLALRPKVSSKLRVTGPWGDHGVNAGVGLSIVKELAREADGVFTLASYSGFHQWNHLQKDDFPSEMTLPAPFPGTLCALQVSQGKLLNQQAVLMQAKKRLRLLDNSNPFEHLFER